ncbi:MAG: hypothetical protein JRD88_09455 [Deltaproteobacteria bacterium]|jgi:ELWxxDGT repeat protein|nr:hypothetical protein [Deltaproteobacteria bacterium]
MMQCRPTVLQGLVTLCVLTLLTLSGCGGGGGGDDGDNQPPPGDFLLFYGDNDNVAGDGLFKIQDDNLVPVKKINFSGQSRIQSFAPFGDKTIFVACDNRGCEPWITDGTTGGTQIVRDINPGPGDSNPQDFLLFAESLFFTAFDPIDGRELWRTDGTEAGTVRVANIGIENPLSPSTPQSSNPGDLTVFKGALFFSADTGPYAPNPNRYGRELWKTDGTEIGTVLVKNIGADDIQQTFNGDPRGLTVYNNYLYFSADDGPFAVTRYGRELWKTDGTETGTILVKNIGIDPDDPNRAYDGAPQEFIVFDNALYFFADNGTNGFEPWKTDGTEAATSLVRNLGDDSISPSPATADDLSYWTEFNNQLYLAAGELWKTDGTEAGTTLVTDINDTVLSVVANRDDVFEVFNGQLLFFADDGENGFEPWVTDGSPEGTALLEAIWSGNQPITASNLRMLTIFNGLLYFSAENGTSGVEIFVTDGVVTNGTDAKLLYDPNRDETGIAPGSDSGYRDHFGPNSLNGVLYFSAYNGVNRNGVEIWKSAGLGIDNWRSSNQAGAVVRLVEDLNLGPPDGALP